MHVERVRELLGDPSMRRVDTVALRAREATAHLFAGRVERAVEIDFELAEQDGLARLYGLCGLLYDLPELGRSDEADKFVDEALSAARASDSPFFLCWALTGAARTLAATDPAAALDVAYEALAVSRADSIRVAEVVILRDVAALESAHGDRHVANEMFRIVLDTFHRAGDWVNLSVTFGELAHHFAETNPEVAATLLGAAGGNRAVRQPRNRTARQASLRHSARRISVRRDDGESARPSAGRTPWPSPKHTSNTTDHHKSCRTPSWPPAPPHRRIQAISACAPRPLLLEGTQADAVIDGILATVPNRLPVASCERRSADRAVCHGHATNDGPRSTSRATCTPGARPAGRERRSDSTRRREPRLQRFHKGSPTFRQRFLTGSSRVLESAAEQGGGPVSQPRGS